MKVNLCNVYVPPKDQTYSTLYQLLAEREPNESISHNTMPTFKEHSDFLDRKPYKGWYLIVAEQGDVKGSIYLTYNNEIGISIFKRHRQQGYGKAAVKRLIEMHPNEKFFLANINPANAKSISLFQNTLGFTLIQHTFRLGVSDLTAEQYDRLTGKGKSDASA